MGKLTDRSLATGVTFDTIIHVVNTGDTSQSSSGSSYKANLEQVLNLSPIVTGGTYNSFSESIDFVGSTLFTPFSVNVSDLLDDTNTFVTGGTFSTGTLTLEKNDGNSVSVTGFTSDNFYTTGVTLNGTVLEFDRNDSTNAYNVDLSGLTSSFTGDTNFANTNLTFDSSREHNLTENHYLQITSDNGVFNEAYLVMAGSDAGPGKVNPGVFIGYGENYYLAGETFSNLISGDNNIQGSNFVSIMGNSIAGPGSGINADILIGSGATQTNQFRNTRPTIISSKNSTVSSGITNSVIIGGENIIATESNVAYVDKLNINTLGTGATISNLGIDINGNVVSGSTSSFTGNTSGNCIDDLYVSNIHSCSPLSINPLDEGNVYFGSTSGVTIDLNNNGNIYTKGDYLIQTNVIDPEILVPLFPSAEVKGYYQLYDYTGSTGVLTFNTSTSGSTGIVFGQSTAPNPRKFGLIRYHGDDHIRDAISPVNGFNFYQNKIVYSIGADTSGTVVNIAASSNNGRYWFEQNGNSPMMIAGGDSSSDLRLGIALNPDGTEIPTAQLQVGGTGTTGTFKYRDGNQQSGYVLTSDNLGNATWQPNSSFTGNTSGDCITDLYVSNLYGCSPITVNDDLLVLSNLETKKGISVGTNYNPTGNTITTSDNYIRYNLTGDTKVNLPSTNGSTPTPKEGQILNIIKFGSHNLRLETLVPNAIQGAPDGRGGEFISGNSLDLLSNTTVSVTLIYDGGLDSWVVMSCSDYNQIEYQSTL